MIGKWNVGEREKRERESKQAGERGKPDDCLQLSLFHSLTHTLACRTSVSQAQLALVQQQQTATRGRETGAREARGGMSDGKSCSKRSLLSLTSQTRKCMHGTGTGS